MATTLQLESGAELEGSGWLQRVSARLLQQEYHFSKLAGSPAGDAPTWSAPNRSQGLRSRVGTSGLEVVPRTSDSEAEAEAWRLRLNTRALGRVGDLEPTWARSVSSEGERVELHHPALVEWFLNQERGIEQGWTIQERPAGSESLVIELGLGAGYAFRLGADGASGDFLDAEGRLRAHYGKLVAWDASERPLRAWMRSVSGGLQVLVDDAQARYPITVDPLIVSPDWCAESNRSFANFGVSVASAGDVNGDGFDDVIVGAWRYDNGQSKEGRAYVYHGSASGLSSTEAWIGEPNVADAWFGGSVSSAGDVNGDGYDDVIVGAWRYTNTGFAQGRAYVYRGSASGLGSSESWSVEGAMAGDNYGWSVAGAGDVNADGFADVIVGARSANNGESGEGVAFVYHGSPAGLGTTHAWSAESNQTGAIFGSSVSSAGDVNGDGYSDVIVGAESYDNGESNEGGAFVYHGSATGLGLTSAWMAESNQAQASFGTSVSGAGDVNGDGYDDVIVGSFEYDNGQSLEGRAWVYLGSGAGLSTSEAWTAEPNQAGARFGFSVSSAGDVNADGFGDVVVGAYTFNNPEVSEGAAFVYLGSATGLLAQETWSAESNQAAALFGWSVSGAGDVNADGFDDVIVGAYHYENPQSDEGGAFLYHGFATPLATGFVHNGSGGNPLCLSSTPPLVGEDWELEVDGDVRAAPTSVAVLVHALAGSGSFIGSGELLLDLSSAFYLSLQAPTTGGTVSFPLTVPADPAMAGLGASAQAVVFGSGFTLCNAYSFSVGF